jgi:hypothetical protein
MLVITDELGEWYQFGIVKPTEYNVWHKLTPIHKVKSGNYRFTFDCKDFARINSFIWVRSVYFKDGKELYSRSTRVYPHSVPIHVELPIPTSLKLTGVESQRLEAKKLFKYYKHEDILWTVRAEELYLNAEQSENTFLLTLSHVVRSEPHPEESDLWLTIFEEKTGYDSYEVGRFYSQNTNDVVSDPIVETYPNRLIASFTSKKPIQPNSIKVRIVA